MISLVFLFMGVATGLAGIARLAKACAGEPKKAERWEKAEIIKQLVARSERENTSAISSPPARARPATTSATSGDTCAYLEPNSKLTSARTSGSSIQVTPNRINAEIEEQIRQRAYELFQERGGMDGNAVDDWRQAKKEVLSKSKAATTSS